MDLKTNVTMIIQKGPRTYTFNMEVGSPFGEAYDAAFEVLNKVSEMSRQAVELASQPQVIEEK